MGAWFMQESILDELACGSMPSSHVLPALSMKPHFGVSIMQQPTPVLKELDGQVGHESSAEKVSFSSSLMSTW